MTAHDHRTFVEGCYRCDLSRDEVEQVDLDALIAGVRDRGDTLRALFPDDGDIRDNARLLETLADALEATLVERDAALAVIEEVRKHVEGDWRAERIERIISSVPVDALSEHDRQVAERAWDEGFDAGQAWESDMNSRTIPQVTRWDNPYLKEEK